MAQDLTAEADSGGHTDNRPGDRPAADDARAARPAAGRSTATPRRCASARPAASRRPAAAAAAFAMGAAYVVTGSVNQACVESGTSDAVRQMLAEAGQADVAMAPAADMFEMGVKVQVLKRGTMFAMRAAKLYELYRAYDEPGRDPRGRARPAGEEHLPRPARRRSGSRRRRSSGRATRRRSSGPSATRSTRWRWSSAGIWASRRAGPTRRADAQGRLPGLVRPGDGRVQRVGQGLVPGTTGGTAAWSTVALNLLHGAAVLLRAAVAARPGRPTARRRTRPARRRTARNESNDACGTARPAQPVAARREMRLERDRPNPTDSAGHHRHRLPVPQGRRRRRVLGQHPRPASTPSADVPADALAARRLLRRRPEDARPRPTPAAAASSTRSTSPRSSSASPPTTSKRPTPRSCSACSSPGRRWTTPATAPGRDVRPQPRQRHPRRHRHAGAGHPARRPARPPALAARP